MNPTPVTRRNLMKAAALFAVVGAVPAIAGSQEGKSPELIKASAGPTTQPDRFKGLKVGVATYSFRKIPLDATIKGILRVRLSYASIKDSHLAMKSTTQERKAVVQKFRDAGITPLSCGNIKLTKDEAASRAAFEYVRDTGAGVMVCAPDAAALPLLDKLVKEFDIKLAIHNHGPEDKTFPSPYEVQAAIKDLDPRIGYCIDVGHTARAGHDPAKAILDCRDRLYDVHMKDVWKLDAKNTSVETEVGRGVLDIKAMLQALLEIKFAGHVGLEHERTPEDPLPGLAESVGYVKGVLAGMA